MSPPIDTPADAALTELAERFERWRRARRNGHARIPEDLWEQAVGLSTVLSNGRVAKRLRLSPTESKKTVYCPTGNFSECGRRDILGVY
jgi:hypothetical protein